MADEVKVTSFVPRAIKGVGEGTLKGMIEVAIRVTSQAKLLAPVNKKVGLGGQLRNSIMWKSYNKTGGITEGQKLSENVTKDEVIVGSATEYAVYQEYGTRKMSAQPYLRPAVDIVTNGTGYEKAVRKAMEDSVRVQLGLEEVI